ncbi:MAG: hypothetical protein KGL93_02995 [Gemmatimonadota bacterium]|nr:hypothetical protein [Gemmatimonadota bacterium]HEU4988573.1 hypothetical protein [Gemmatimonadaceae bacterium]
MSITVALRRHLLQSCAIAFVAVGVLIGLPIIHAVSADLTPTATPDRAVPVLWGIVLLNLLSGTMVWMAARRPAWAKSAIMLPGLACLLFGIALSDAGIAYYGEGAAMRAAAILLFICSAANVIGGAIAIATASMRQATA